MSRTLPLVLAGAIMLAAVGYFAGVFNNSPSQSAQSTMIEQSDVADLTAAAEGSEPVQATSDAAVIDMTLGNVDAPVTLVEYASFTCPHCARFHEDVYPDLKKDFIDTGKVKFVFREVYFDRVGLWAGLLARCGGQEKYFGITEILFKRQSEWSRGESGAEVAQNLYKIGKIAGMSEDQMETCLQNKEHAQALVTEYQKNATADAISSTPSLIVNGTNHGNISYGQLTDLLNKAAE